MNFRYLFFSHWTKTDPDERRRLGTGKVTVHTLYLGTMLDPILPIRSS